MYFKSQERGRAVLLSTHDRNCISLPALTQPWRYITVFDRNVANSPRRISHKNNNENVFTVVTKEIQAILTITICGTNNPPPFFFLFSGLGCPKEGRLPGKSRENTWSRASRFCNSVVRACRNSGSTARMGACMSLISRSRLGMRGESSSGLSPTALVITSTATCPAHRHTLGTTPATCRTHWLSHLIPCHLPRPREASTSSPLCTMRNHLAWLQQRFLRRDLHDSLSHPESEAKSQQ